MRRGIAIAAAMLAASAAEASDPKPCGAELVCASSPTSVAAAMMRAGYQASLDKDNQGDPAVSSAAAGYKFDVLFYDCKDHKDCGALQFRVSFTKDPSFTHKLVNDWNLDRRFAQMSLRQDGTLIVNHDVTTVGGLNRANFTDNVEWWAGVLGELYKFLNPAPAAKPAEPKAPAT